MHWSHQIGFGAKRTKRCLRRVHVSRMTCLFREDVRWLLKRDACVHQVTVTCSVNMKGYRWILSLTCFPFLKVHHAVVIEFVH